MSIIRTKTLSPEQVDAVMHGEPFAWYDPPLDADTIIFESPCRAARHHCRWCLGYLNVPEDNCPCCGRSDGERLTCAEAGTIAQRMASILLEGDVSALDWLGSIVTEYGRLMEARVELDEDPEATQMAICEARSALSRIRDMLATARGNWGRSHDGDRP